MGGRVIKRKKGGRKGRERREGREERGEWMRY